MTDIQTKETDITIVRVSNVKYNIYSFVLVVSYFIVWGYISSLIEDYDFLVGQRDTLASTNARLKSQVSQFDNYMTLLNQIDQHHTGLVTCFNAIEGCDQLPKILIDNRDIVRSYLLLGSLVHPRMIVDERKILANVNEFLLKVDGDINQNQRNGKLNRLSIGKPESINDTLYKVPIQLSISFDDKDALLSFLGNVEKRVPSNPVISVLYVIDQITYDIINYNDKQEVMISMTAYYY